jgi:hypothetical protein
MEDQADRIDRRAEELRRASLVELGKGGVGEDDVPAPVDGKGRIRLVRLEDAVDRRARRG